MQLQISRNKKSAVTALFLFCFCLRVDASLPLAETIYTIPEGKITTGFSEEIIRIDGNYRKEAGSIGIGILPDFSIWYSFDYIHENIINTSASTLGDSFLKIWFYLFDFKTAHAGLMLDFRLPTGPNAYTNTKWRNLSFGNNELKIGPVSRIDIYKSIYLHLNLFYVFRQGQNEGFYGKLYFNPLKKETFTNLFGLNFKSRDAFLGGGRLKNDYAVYSMAVNTDIVYPVIPYIEFYASHRVYKKQGNENDHIPIEGSAINPVLLSAGARYFFFESVYAGLYYIYNPINEKNYIKDIFGFDFSLQF